MCKALALQAPGLSWPIIAQRGFGSARSSVDVVSLKQSTVICCRKAGFAVVFFAAVRRAGADRAKPRTCRSGAVSGRVLRNFGLELSGQWLGGQAQAQGQSVLSLRRLAPNRRRFQWPATNKLWQEPSWLEFDEVQLKKGILSRLLFLALPVRSIMMTELVHALPSSLSNLAFVCMRPPKLCFRARVHCFTVAVCRPSGGQHGYTHTSALETCEHTSYTVPTSNRSMWMGRHQERHTAIPWARIDS